MSNKNITFVHFDIKQFDLLLVMSVQAVFSLDFRIYLNLGLVLNPIRQTTL